MNAKDILAKPQKRAADTLWAYTISIGPRSVRQVLPIKRLQALWTELPPVCHRHDVEPPLMLAVILVESALCDGTQDAIRYFPPQVTHQHKLDRPMVEMLDVEFATQHLSVLCRQYNDRRLALAAYHVGPRDTKDKGLSRLSDGAVTAST